MTEGDPRALIREVQRKMRDRVQAIQRGVTQSRRALDAQDSGEAIFLTGLFMPVIVAVEDVAAQLSEWADELEAAAPHLPWCQICGREVQDLYCVECHRATEQRPSALLALPVAPQEDQTSASTESVASLRDGCHPSVPNGEDSGHATHVLRLQLQTNDCFTEHDSERLHVRVLELLREEGIPVAMSLMESREESRHADNLRQTPRRSPDEAA